MYHITYLPIFEDHAMSRYIHGMDVYVSTDIRHFWKLPAPHEYGSHAPASELFYRSLPKCEGKIYYYMKEES